MWHNTQYSTACCMWDCVTMKHFFFYCLASATSYSAVSKAFDGQLCMMLSTTLLLPPCSSIAGRHIQIKSQLFCCNQLQIICTTGLWMNANLTQGMMLGSWIGAWSQVGANNTIGTTTCNTVWMWMISIMTEMLCAGGWNIFHLDSEGLLWNIMPHSRMQKMVWERWQLSECSMWCRCLGERGEKPWSFQLPSLSTVGFYSPRRSNSQTKLSCISTGCCLSSLCPSPLYLQKDARHMHVCKSKGIYPGYSFFTKNFCRLL